MARNRPCLLVGGAALQKRNQLLNHSRPPIAWNDVQQPQIIRHRLIGKELEKRLIAMASNLIGMASSTLVAMASNLHAMASNLIAMASTPVAMASNQIAMASNLIAMPSNALWPPTS